ncbi:MAG: type IX secretion system sortase PorU [Bacteroidaceae bacterium]|nr:type IX secretion system sortase PorU [Bacteroidaceae bacterium]
MLLLPLWAGAHRAAAQHITTLDWGELHIDSVLPVYTEVVPLETDYRLFDYCVSVEYPEWAPLTTEEVRRLEHILSASGQAGVPLIGEELNVSASLSVSRKQGMLDIAFVPLVRRNGKYQKLLNASIVITSTPKARKVARAVLPAERYVHNSVLAQGRWVKICITQDGMYRLTRSALSKMGFSNPDNVRLYGYGGYRLPEVIDPDNEYDDLQEVPLYKADPDTWLFWGNGLVYWNGNTRVFNPYATKAYYFLTEADTPSQIETVDGSTNLTGGYDSFTDHVLYEKDEYAWFHGGRHLYENVDYATSNTHTYRLSTVNSMGQELLTIAFTASASTATQLSPQVNGNELELMTMSKLSSYIYATQAVRTSDVSSMSNGSEWTVKLTSTVGNPARLDYLALHYARQLKPHDGYVAFSQNTSGPSQFNITGSGLQLMCIGEPGRAACLVQGTQDGDVYRAIVEDASRRYVAFDPTFSFPQPTVVGEIENQNLHRLDSLDMVIIVPTSNVLAEQAERLAEAHREYDGLRVVVVRADQVYNEFSSGTPDATAYRRLMKMLYDRAEDEGNLPRYLLLFGDCAWDNRMLSTAWRKNNPDNYLLCFQSENSFSDTQSYVMEDYFGLLDDGEGARLTDDKVDIGVGRFPVISAAEAKVVVDKTINHLSNAYAGSWKNIISVMGDDGDNNEHLEMADDVAERIIRDNPEMEVRKVMWDAYTRVSTLSGNTYPAVTQLIQEQMDEGALAINYTGHGAYYCLSHEQVLKLSDFARYKGSRLPLWITAACDVTPFDGLNDNIGETAMLNEGGAAVAFYGTARTVYADRNLQMNRWFMHYLLATDSLGRRYRVGDAIRLAKNYLIDGKLETSHRENKLHYALLGDPALTFGAPLNRVVLDSINGVAVDSAADMQLQAGQRVHMSGHIVGADGDSLRSFSGILTARVYDNLETVVCKNNADAKKGPFTFTSRNNVLFNGQDSVADGRFSLDFVVPLDINYSNEAGRAVFYAVNNEHTMEANGYNESFTVGDITSTVDSDEEGPQIYAYLNTEDFENGGTVNSTPFFVALLKDESGINYSGSGLGHDLLLTIDDNVNTTYVLNDYYTSEFGDFTQGAVGYSIPELPEGPHRLKFRAWDVLNNTNSATLDFVVDADLNPTLLGISATQNPAVSGTNFLINYSLPGTDCDLLLEVFDFAGQRMWSHSCVVNTATGIYVLPWNLTMSGGGRLGAGIYLYRVTMRSGTSKKVSEAQKIIVHGNN